MSGTRRGGGRRVKGHSARSLCCDSPMQCAAVRSGAERQAGNSLFHEPLLAARRPCCCGVCDTVATRARALLKCSIPANLNTTQMYTRFAHALQGQGRRTAAHTRACTLHASAGAWQRLILLPHGLLRPRLPDAAAAAAGTGGRCCCCWHWLLLLLLLLMLQALHTPAPPQHR
jgi:hypothetical protein